MRRAGSAPSASALVRTCVFCALSCERARVCVHAVVVHAGVCMLWVCRRWVLRALSARARMCGQRARAAAWQPRAQAALQRSH